MNSFKGIDGTSSSQEGSRSPGRAPGSGRPTPYRLARSVLSILVGVGVLWSLLGAVGGWGIVRSASAASDPVIGAAGDIACDPASSTFNNGLGTSNACHQKYTYDLLANAGLTAVLGLGDNQYYCGSLAAFNQSYALSWGNIKSITHPVPGNHEYLTSGGTGCDSTNSGAAGYFNYFGSAAGSRTQSWYSYDVGTWHIIALNSQCGSIGGCSSTSDEYKWLQADLQSHTNSCTLAYWHIPLFSSGGRATTASKPFWNLLYQYNADVVLNGHDHIYERFAPQDPSGTADPVRGIRQFTVGTGGNSHTTLGTTAANSQVVNDNTFGVLKLTLHATSYDWQFAPESGHTFTDTGTANCHDGSSGPTSTPLPTSTPGGTSSVTFAPQADAYVNASYPTTNYGTLTSLRADASPVTNSYLRFAVAGLNGASITRARLLLYMNSSSSSGLKAMSVADNTWGETTINYGNAPASGGTLASAASVSAGTWVSFDVSASIKAEGTYSFGVTTPGSTAISFAARESGANAPKLTLDLGSGSVATATNTPQPATPTSTSIAAPTNTPTAAPLPTSTPTGAPAATNTPTPVSLPSSTPTAGPAATATPTAAAQSVTFLPQADTYVNASYPTTNYGTSTQLRADASPTVNSYARFTVAALNGAPIKRVRLLFYMNSGSSAGLQALTMSDNTWGETTLTYSNAPAMGSTIATSGAAATGTWVTLDVTSYVTAEGTYSFGVITPGSTAISFASRESGANAPQLIVDLGP